MSALTIVNIICFYTLIVFEKGLKCEYKFSVLV